MAKTLEKKRLVLPLINEVIAKLVAMSADAANLEYNDNEQASFRLKRSFVDLRDNEMKNLHTHIMGIRNEINNKYNQSKKRKDESD